MLCYVTLCFQCAQNVQLFGMNLRCCGVRFMCSSKIMMILCSHCISLVYFIARRICAWQTMLKCYLLTDFAGPLQLHILDRVGQQRSSGAHENRFVHSIDCRSSISQVAQRAVRSRQSTVRCWRPRHRTSALQLSAFRFAWCPVAGWRRGSVVRTPIFGWPTLPRLWLTCVYFVGSVRYGSTNQANSAFHPSGVGL